MANGVKSVKKKSAPPPRPIAITPHFDFEREAFRSGHRWVAGADEVGRGPLAGPVGVAAVILDPDDLPEGLDDSKVLQAPAREFSVPAHAPITGARFDWSRKKSDRRPKKVSKRLKPNIL